MDKETLSGRVVLSSLTLYEGDGVTVIVGSKTYRGTLVQDGDRWYVKLAGVEPGETDEVVIAKL